MCNGKAKERMTLWCSLPGSKIKTLDVIIGCCRVPVSEVPIILRTDNRAMLLIALVWREKSGRGGLGRV